jgi:NAD(P)-dependent dehydrogenase (short-subunit alcohol dehydrogenase family)
VDYPFGDGGRRLTWNSLGRSPVVLLAGGVVISVAAAAATFGRAPQSSSENSTPRSMRDAVVLITGSTDGLGREVARRTAALGAEVIVHGRNRQRGTALVEEITGAGGRARFYAADFASLAAVRELAETILRDVPRLDVLVNNAGIWINSDVRQVSADGHELQFAVNYLSGFLLTRMLLPRLLESPNPRIVNVASGAQSPLDFKDLMLERPGRASQGYAQSKLAQILFTIDLAEELGDKAVVTALHPATLMDTTMVRDSGLAPQSTIDEGAAAVMHQITSSQVRSGEYYEGVRRERAHSQAYDRAARAELRRISVQLTAAAATAAR